jgi:HPt (histidine-containing phosphotransfer) domain-containing protein
MPKRVGITIEIGEDSIAEMVAMFERDTRETLAAMQMPELDRATLIRDPRSLKGASASVRAVALSACAVTLERRLIHNGAMEAEDIARLTRAFEAWRTEVHASARVARTPA